MERRTCEEIEGSQLTAATELRVCVVWSMKLHSASQSGGNIRLNMLCFGICSILDSRQWKTVLMILCSVFRPKEVKWNHLEFILPWFNKTSSYHSNIKSFHGFVAFNQFLYARHQVSGRYLRFYDHLHFFYFFFLQKCRLR